MSCSIQNRNFVCDQNRTVFLRSKQGLKDRLVQENQRLLLRIGGRTKIIDIPVGTEATDNGGTRRSVDCGSEVAYGDLAVIADPDPRPMAKDEGPPRTGWDWPQNRAFICQRLLTRRLRRNPQFAVDLVGIGMRQ